MQPMEILAPGERSIVAIHLPMQVYALLDLYVNKHIVVASSLTPATKGS